MQQTITQFELRVDCIISITIYGTKDNTIINTIPFFYWTTEFVIIRKALQSCIFTNSQHSVLQRMQNYLYKNTRYVCDKLYVRASNFTSTNIEHTWLWGSARVTTVDTISSHHKRPNGLQNCIENRWWHWTLKYLNSGSKKKTLTLMISHAQMS
jgi:hypothetical protein